MQIGILKLLYFWDISKKGELYPGINTTSVTPKFPDTVKLPLLLKTVYEEENLMSIYCDLLRKFPT